MSLNSLEQVEFAENPEARCAVSLLLDTSGSMSGEAEQLPPRPIDELNAGLKAFETELKADKLASLRVEVAIVTFGGDRARAIDPGTGGLIETGFDAAHAFVTVDKFQPPVLEASGLTPMGEAVRHALALTRDRKDIYKRNAIDYYRPWIFLITDGYPTDEWELAAEEAREEQGRGGVAFYAVGTEKADLDTLARFSEQPPLTLKGLAFQELFQWLSNSLSSIAHEQPGSQVPLPPADWASADTSHPE